MTRRSRGLGDLERAVVDVLWAAGPGEWLSVRQVHDALSGSRDAAYTTVMTVLDRLARKGVLEQQRAGRAYGYRAATSRAEMTAALMRETLEEFDAEHRPDALVAFVKEASSEEIEALRAALDRLG